MDHQSLAVPDHLRSVELRHLRSFLVIAGSATMTEAAAALGISQPSISALLASVEKHLGVRLFDRDRNGVRITADGRRLRDLVLGPVVALNAGLAAFGSDDRPVRVGVPTDLGPGLRDAVQKALLGRFSGRPVQWQELADDERIEALRLRQVDAMVEWGSVEGVESVMVEGAAYGLQMSSASPLAGRTVVSGADLVDRRVATAGGADLLRAANILPGLVENGWNPRSGFVAIHAPEDLVGDPRTVLVTPEPEVDDPRLTWRPFVVPFTECAWLTIC